MKSALRSLLILSIVFLMARVSSMAECPCSNPCLDPNEPDDPIGFGASSCGDQEHPCVACCGTEVVISVGGGDCDCIWEFTEGCPHAPCGCMDTLTFSVSDGDLDVTEEDGCYSGTWTITSNTPSGSASEPTEYTLTAVDEACGHDDPDKTSIAYILWVEITDLVGPRYVCRGVNTAFTIKTNPEDCESRISPSWTAEEGSPSTGTGHIFTTQWTEVGAYEVTVSCGSSHKEIMVEVIEVPECRDSCCNRYAGGFPSGCSGSGCAGFPVPDLRTPWVSVTAPVPPDLGGMGPGSSDSGAGGCGSERIEIYTCSSTVFYYDSCGRCYEANFDDCQIFPCTKTLTYGLDLTKNTEDPWSTYTLTDWSGRTVYFTAPNGTANGTGVDPYGDARRHSWPSSVVDAEGHVTGFNRVGPANPYTREEGALTSVELPNGETWTYGHAGEDDNKITNITAPDQTTVVEIDYKAWAPYHKAHDKPTAVRVKVSGQTISTTSYTYDDKGRLTGVTKDGRDVGYGYTEDLQGNITKITVTDYSTDPDTVTEYQYVIEDHPELTVVTRKHPTNPSYNQVWTYEFYIPEPPASQVRGYLIKVTDPLENATTYDVFQSEQVELQGKVYNVTDALGRETYYDYNPVTGLLRGISYLNGTYTEDYTYHEHNNDPTPWLRSVQNVRGNYTYYEHNDGNAPWRVTAMKVHEPVNGEEPDWDNDVDPIREYQYYDNANPPGEKGLLRYETVPDIEGTNDQVTEYIYYDQTAGRLYYSPIEVKYQYPDGQGGYYTGSDKTAYDDMGNVTSTTDANNRTIGYDETYEEVNGQLCRIMTTEYATGRDTHSAYSPCCGTLLWTKDEDERETHYAYDGANRVTKVWTNLSGQSSTYPLVEYTYDVFGNVDTVTTRSDSGTTRVTSYEYDDLNRVTRIEHPSPLGPEEFAYDEVGNLIGTRCQKADESWVAMAYEHDDLNRVIAVKYDYASWPPTFPLSDPDVTYTYHQGSHLRATTVDSAGKKAEYNYDIRDRLTDYTPSHTPNPPYPPERMVEYDYNNLGEKTQMILDVDGDPVHTVDYAYFKNGWLKNAQWDSSTIATYTYDAVGNRTQVDYVGNDTYYTYAYQSDDPRYFVSGITHRKVGQQDPLLAITYPDRDGAGNPEQMQDSAGTTYYTYDSNSRLATVTYPGQSQWTNSFDWVGNRLNLPPDTNTLEYNSADQLTRWPNHHRYTHDDIARLEYQKDDSSNIEKAYSYTDVSLLESILHDDVSGDPVSEMTWDADGDRVSFTSSTGGTWEFVYDPTAGIPAVLEENDGTDSVYYIREPDGSLISRVGGESIAYYHFDGLGSTRLLTDGDGDITDEYIYDAWGKLTDHTANAGSVEQPYMFVGQLGYYSHYQDPNLFDENGWQFLQLGCRFYDPDLGRFTQRDPEGHGLNWYAYASDTPAVAVDPQGLQSVPGDPSWIAQPFYDAFQAVAAHFLTKTALCKRIREYDEMGYDYCVWIKFKVPKPYGQGGHYTIYTYFSAKLVKRPGEYGEYGKCKSCWYDAYHSEPAKRPWWKFWKKSKYYWKTVIDFKSDGDPGCEAIDRDVKKNCQRIEGQ